MICNIFFNAPHPNPPRSRGGKKVAFTLAEVLITLGIIGVVAAMTIPTLMTKIQEKQLYNSWKRVYGILNQAYRLAAEEYGDYSGWASTSADDYEKIKPFLKLANDCPVTPWGTKSNCWPDANYTCFNGGGPVACTGNGNWPKTSASNSTPSVRLLSGESIVFMRDGYGVNFIVDLNSNKKPNQLGVDLHYFSIVQDSVNKDFTVYPGVVWLRSKPKNEQILKCQRNVTDLSGGAGWNPGSGCGFWILKHGNMDYLHMTDEQIADNW